ncbi:MAG: Flp family type IVb pilin [Pseudomonadota bacterium]
MQKLVRFLKDKSGATAIEYGLIAALIAVAVIGGATTVGNNTNNTLNGIGGKIVAPA